MPNLLANGPADGAAVRLVWVDLRAAASGPGADALAAAQRADVFELARSVLAAAGRGARKCVEAGVGVVRPSGEGFVVTALEIIAARPPAADGEC